MVLHGSKCCIDPLGYVEALIGVHGLCESSDGAVVWCALWPTGGHCGDRLMARSSVCRTTCQQPVEQQKPNWMCSFKPSLKRSKILRRGEEGSLGINNHMNDTMASSSHIHKTRLSPASPPNATLVMALLCGRGPCTGRKAGWHNPLD